MLSKPLALACAGLFLAAGSAHAGADDAKEGTIYSLIYECDADAINANMVQICTTQFPSLAAEGRKALTAWRERNGTVATDSKTRCLRHVDDQLRTATPGMAEQTRKRFKEVKEEIGASFRTHVEKDGQPACTAMFGDLKQPGGSADFR